MKKLLYTVASLACCLTHLFSQPCLPEGIIFSTQVQIDSFQVNYPNCTEIQGYVIIKGDDINNLNGLIVLTSIESYLNIGGMPACNPILESLTGLENLTTVGGDINIDGNHSLTSLTGLENLSYIGGSLVIKSNYALSSLVGLTNLTTINGGLNIGGIDAQGNPSLTTLTGLNNLTSIGALLVMNNELLQNLTGLNNLNSIGYIVVIKNNDAMTSLIGLENITSIENNLWITGNDALLSFQGLNNLNNIVGYLRIDYNEDLNDISALSNLTSLGGFIIIDYNPSLTSLEGLNGISSTLSYLTITSNTSLLNFDGLNNLASIWGGLTISGNYSIVNFSGLDQLTFLHGSFLVTDNLLLENFSGLENLTTLEGSIWIGNNLYGGGNPQLNELSGLGNIEAGSIDGLHIENNNSLNYCNIKSICNYLVAPQGTVEIYNNASGCNSQQEVEEACLTKVEEVSFEDSFSISPNPFSGATHLQFGISEQGIVICDLFEISGVKIKSLLNEEKIPGTYKMEIDLSDLPKGAYFCVLKTSPEYLGQTQKLIKF